MASDGVVEEERDHEQQVREREEDLGDAVVLGGALCEVRVWRPLLFLLGRPGVLLEDAGGI